MPRSRKQDNLKKKTKKYNTLLVILTITLIIIIALFVYRQMQYKQTEVDSQKALEQMAQILETNDETEEIDLSAAEIRGHKVIGKVKINRIGLEYPILEETTPETLNLSITKFSGPGLNENGNVTLAGHNNRNGTMFSKLSNIINGDEVEITTIRRKQSNLYSI